MLPSSWAKMTIKLWDRVNAPADEIHSDRSRWLSRTIHFESDHGSYSRWFPMKHPTGSIHQYFWMLPLLFSSFDSLFIDIWTIFLCGLFAFVNQMDMWKRPTPGNKFSDPQISRTAQNVLMRVRVERGWLKIMKTLKWHHKITIPPYDTITVKFINFTHFSIATQHTCILYAKSCINIFHIFEVINMHVIDLFICS